MGEDRVVRVEGGLAGVVWIIGWLFTVGFLHLGVPKSVFAIVISAYYLGAAHSR